MALASQTKLLFSLRFIKFTEPARSKTTRELVYKKHGEPVDVVEIVERELPSLGKHDVHVRMLAAPINPSDINTIQGRYPIKPKLPGVGGNEGVGIVTEVGKEVKTFVPGNKVILVETAQGTWRTDAVYNQKVLRCVPCELGNVEASTLMVNSCTAYRMLTDFKPIRKKNNMVVIQNGANSSVGQNVIQLCKAWGIKNINVVRDRPNIKDLKQYLQDLGATHVITEKELIKKNPLFKNKLIDKPVLGLNCVGGSSSLGMLKILNNSGVMVTYGGMSTKPVAVPTGALIFKNLSFVGFWMTRWHKKANKSEQDKMLTELINLICKNELKAPVYKLIAIDNFKEALDNAMKSHGFTGCKYILDCNNN